MAGSRARVSTAGSTPPPSRAAENRGGMLEERGLGPPGGLPRLRHPGGPAAPGPPPGPGGVADGDFARLRHAGEHAALALQLGTEAVAELVHAMAGIADHRDLELGLAGADALADRPLLDVVALDGDVLADLAGRDVDRFEVLLGDEQNLALRRVAVGAALEALACDCLPPLVRLRAAALAGR